MVSLIDGGKESVLFNKQTQMEVAIECEKNRKSRSNLLVTVYNKSWLLRMESIRPLDGIQNTFRSIKLYKPTFWLIYTSSN